MGCSSSIPSTTSSPRARRGPRARSGHHPRADHHAIPPLHQAGEHLGGAQTGRTARQGHVPHPARRREGAPPAPGAARERLIGVEALKALHDDGNKDDVLPIISISFCWDTAPDPSVGQAAATVAAKLKNEMAKYKEANGSFKGFSEMGIFWDWASLYQKDPKLFDPSETPEAKPEGAERDAFLVDLKEKRRFYGGETYEKSRTPEQIEGFRYALHETMDLWYAHQGTTVYMLTTLPRARRARPATTTRAGRRTSAAPPSRSRRSGSTRQNGSSCSTWAWVQRREEPQLATRPGRLQRTDPREEWHWASTRPKLSLTMSVSAAR